MLDRFVNGDPTNDNANGTAWEHDLTGTQLRHGGDIKGLQDTLDYLTGMGIKGIYLAGSPMINFPWGSDAFSPLDLTLLDPHFATIQIWRECIDEMHARGMYVIFDNTMATLGDLIGFEGFLNVSTPLNYGEYNDLWKTSRRYHDFQFNNTELDVCDVEYPRFWDDYGQPVNANGSQYLKGCRDSEFDQYGDIAAFDIYPEWQRQISKFASVQDRLREWKPSVREKIQHLSCIQISMLDVDGFRMDKGQQITVDAQGEFADFIRQCAARFGKKNFFIPGEIVSGNAFGAIYLGRGKEPSMAVNDTNKAVQLTTDTAADDLFIRAKGKNAFDAACFHYSTYRAMTRFLGMDGDLGAKGETPADFILAWNDFIRTNDLINPNTGVFDPRHMYGAQNQDVFRWPTIIDGTQKQILANYVTTMLLPGIPMLEWGEEQAYYVLDNTASNYVFGRQSMSSATAWQDHGCYTVGNAKFATWPGDSCFDGCKDDWNSLDHRDPSHPIRNIMTAMFEMRQRYPVLNDGFYVDTIAKQTHPIYLPGSLGVATETGLWSVRRSGWPDIQDFTTQGMKVQDVWLVFHNDNKEVDYIFDCSSNTTGLNAPFDNATTVKNLFYPYDEYTLGTTPQPLELDNMTEVNGCLDSMTLPAYGFKAFVPVEKWQRPSPVITKFNPGHDARILSNASAGEHQNVTIDFLFSDEMNCDAVQKAITVTSTTEDGSIPTLGDVSCSTVNDSTARVSQYTGPITAQIPGTWMITGTLTNVADGVHSVNVANVSTQLGNTSTNAVNHFLLRVGQMDNPMVFPRSANYSNSLLYERKDKSMYISQKAAGADLFRYSTNWGSSWSNWVPYSGGNFSIETQTWSGTSAQAWSGKHVQVEYWSQKTGSSNHQQQGDLASSNSVTRRYPHIFIHGSFNQYGYDSGLAQTMSQNESGIWKYDFMTEWPSEFQINVWGSNPSGQPDLSRAFGDVDGDGVLDLLSPVSLLKNVVNLTTYPPAPYLAYHIEVNDGDMRYHTSPTGSQYRQSAIYALLILIPIITSSIGVWLYLFVFYDVKFNKFGKNEKSSILPMVIREKVGTSQWLPNRASGFLGGLESSQCNVMVNANRKKILIATMEYDIDDWDIKIKIGGLGVMAQTMSKHLEHQDLIWVVPCVNGIHYPTDQKAKPITVTVLGQDYTVHVQYHHLRNITYVLLDAPVFRQQTKENPYPERMDDIDSAVYYSAWNSCIAEVIRRFPIDLYHINDYHGAVAPLHLLPRVIPCCLSLHNAEFQGLWPMRTPTEFDEICRIYNLRPEVVSDYVQFGEVFNLLHAGASYLRVWQKGYGAAGVSEKYGKRSFARYPILWGLDKVGSLPNPDPTDTEVWDKQPLRLKDVAVDEPFEAGRGELRRQAQDWAGLKVDPEAELFVFVGRWSHQKGVDLIADVFPAILEEHSKAQLICIGPVIDLYGKFAALKLSRLMQLYPERVYSKPEFTALPPYIFSGAEFALIPSRDEPFGLVAVEFGRKGALGVGARVGGLGNMPGWWFTIESTTSKHLISQFKMAIQAAMASKTNVRAKMRARAAKQRFPVAQWKEDLSVMQDTAISLSQKQAFKPRNKNTSRFSAIQSIQSGLSTPRFRSGQSGTPNITAPPSGESTRAPSPAGGSGRKGPLSLGLRTGPGHTPKGEVRERKRLTKSRPASRATSPNGRSSTRGSRSSSPAYFLKRRSRSKVRASALSMTVQDAPSVPSLPEQIAGRRVSRFTEGAGEGVVATTNANQGDVRGFMFQDDAIYESDAPDGSDSANERTDQEDNGNETIIDESVLNNEQRNTQKKMNRLAALRVSLGSTGEASQPNLIRRASSSGSDDASSRPGTPDVQDRMLASDSNSGSRSESPIPAPPAAHLSLGSVLQGKKDYKLQSVEPFFNDPTGLYYNAFDKKLDKLNGKSSEGSLCIEEYLTLSEKDWFNRFRSVKMGKSAASTPASSVFRLPMARESASNSDSSMVEGEEFDLRADQYLLAEDYQPPTGLKRILMTRIGQWPLYSFLLGFGQIIAANSYQITLLTGEVGEAAEKLYILASIYLVASIMWWIIFRTCKSVFVLAIPFAFYGMAFFLLGMAPYGTSVLERGWIQNVATAFYAVASSSGAFFFSLNFGSEGSVPVATWSFRACVIQGSQQIYVVVLWFWGSRLTQETLKGIVVQRTTVYGPTLTGITIPIALFLWSIGVILYRGLPDYYRQTPGQIPSFYQSVMRRKIVLWFFVTVLIQNFFLSAPYGRNWRYLFSSAHAPAWMIWLLVIAFFVVLWAVMLWAFSSLSKRHSWILPMFAVALGAPRWCQMLWGTSGMGAWVPWAGSPLAGALVGRTLWLWLGTLDAIQGVGFGMILLQTLTRFHVVFALVCAQVLGSIATIVARAAAPDGNGPATVFPNLAMSLDGLKHPAFWVTIVFQLIICAGFFRWFRKEQLTKP